HPASARMPPPPLSPSPTLRQLPLPKACRSLPMFSPPLCRAAHRTCGSLLLIQPDVFHPPVIVDAVDHHSQPFDFGVPADAAAVEVDERLGVVLGQPPLDLPDGPLGLFLVCLHRLLLRQCVDLGVAGGVVCADLSRPA